MKKLVSVLLLGVLIASPGVSQGTASKKPNILMIMADDIGWFNVSAFNLGTMGYKTPNIDRIAREGALFTDWYSQQSCTAGRAAFICGQSPIRTGLTKVGLPGADVGLRGEVPTAHGFDEFFGNLYHLNAEEEPEDPDYPKDPEFRKRFGPRGVLRSYADGRIENTGPLSRKRMETVDEEFMGAALDFMDRQVKADKPFFCYFNSTRMHVFTHLKPESDGKSGFGLYPDGMLELDDMVGRLLKKLEDLGIADNTIVVFTTDNGAETFTWPDGGTTPFKGEKATNWEGAFRAPTVMRWPGVIKPGSIYNDICAHEDLIPTFAAAAGEPNLVAKVAKGYQANGKTFKVHLDGYNLMPSFRGEAKEWPRQEFLYWSDDAELMAIRIKQWKIAFLEQHGKVSAEYPMGVWSSDFTRLRVPVIYNLRADPFERGPDSALYASWMMHKNYLFVPAQVYVGRWLQSFKEFPIRQKPPSFNLDEVMAKLSAPQKN